MNCYAIKPNIAIVQKSINRGVNSTGLIFDISRTGARLFQHVYYAPGTIITYDFSDPYFAKRTAAVPNEFKGKVGKYDIEFLDFEGRIPFCAKLSMQEHIFIGQTVSFSIYFDEALHCACATQVQAIGETAKKYFSQPAHY